MTIQIPGSATDPATGSATGSATVQVTGSATVPATGPTTGSATGSATDQAPSRGVLIPSAICAAIRDRPQIRMTHGEWQSGGRMDLYTTKKGGCPFQNSHCTVRHVKTSV